MLGLLRQLRYTVTQRLGASANDVTKVSPVAGGYTA